MSALQTSPVTRNATSLQVLESGPSLFVEPDGQMTFLYGPQVARASLTARQVKELGLPMSVTFGQPFTTSPESDSLAESLASKFLERLGTAGLISSKATWKRQATPSGRYVLALMSPVSLSKDREFTLLPSISAREWRDRSQAQILARLDRGDGVAKRICRLSSQLHSSPEVVGLNPLFAAWLMNLPQAWGHCMPSETPSTLRRLRSSLPPTWPPNPCPPSPSCT